MNLVTVALVPVCKAALAAVGFGISIYVGRVLGAEAFGVYAAATATVVIFAGIIQHVADVAYLRALEDENPIPEPVAIRANLTLRAIGVTGSLILLGSGYGLALLGGWAVPFPGAMMAVIGVGVAATVVMSGSQIIHQARRHYARYLALDLALYALRLSGLLALTLAGKLAALPVFAAHALAPAISALASPFRPGPAAAPGAVRAAMGRMIHSGGWIGLAFTFSIVTGKLDLLILAFMSTAQEAGIYAAAMNLAIVAEFGGSFLLVVFYPNILRWHRDGRLRTVLVRFVTVAAPLAMICAFFGARFSQPLITLAYGPGYSDAAAVFAVLAPLCLFMMLVQPVAAPFINLRAPRTLCAIEAAGLIAALVALGILVPQHGALGAAWAVLAVRGAVGLTILVWAFVNAHPGYSSPSLADFGTDLPR